MCLLQCFFRFHKFLGISIFVSPLKPGDISGPFELKLPFNASDSWKDEIPEVVFWDPSMAHLYSCLFLLLIVLCTVAGLYAWRIASYSACPRPTHVDWKNGILSVQVSYSLIY